MFGPVFVAPALGIYAMAIAAPLRRWVPLVALLVPMIMAGHWQDRYLGLLNPSLYAGLVSGIAIAVVPAMIALLRRSRRETEREVRAQERRRTAYEERLRIARDVHDVVGHSLSVITMQAGVALHLLEKRHALDDRQAPGQPRSDQVAESLEAIKKTSREALAELRTTLGVFREDPDQPRAPLPGLGRLDDLVGALRAAGRTVEVVHEPVHDHVPLPAAVDQAAFRIIQESLTNVTRHTGSARATVRIGYAGDRLVVEVADDGPAGAVPAEGNGIRGMQERARAVGGTVTLSTNSPSGLVVRAELPIAGGDAR
jgi:signal transduction histidine kinase